MEPQLAEQDHPILKLQVWEAEHPVRYPDRCYQQWVDIVSQVADHPIQKLEVLWLRLVQRKRKQSRFEEPC
jgi:hypothetical protein